MLVVIKLFFTVILADLFSGFVHWLEDVYAKPGMPLVHRIAVENELHHTEPRAFLKKNWWQSSWDSILAGVVILIGAWQLSLLSWSLVLFTVLSANANQIHKWTHQNIQERPKLVTLLQQYKILQTTRHHAKHHSGEKNTHYCVITNLLNPVLEKINFWRRLETLFAKLHFKAA